jgi:putative transposase
VPRPRETGRYTNAFKEEVLAQVASGRTGIEVCQQYGIPEATLYRWKRAAQTHDGTVPDPQSTRPLASGPSPINDEHRALVLSIKAKLPNAGLAQVQNQLKRFHGVKLSRPMIGRIFTEAGIPLQKRSRAEPSDPAQNRFEMTRPNELWAVDFKEMWIQSTKTYGLFVLDDYSRFCVGHAVTETATAELAIATVETAIQRYGRPERILSDRGPQFHAWNGVSKFDAFLADFLVDHSVTKAGHCFTNGKVESFNRSLQSEVLDVEEFASLTEAERAITTWVHRYNFHRTHMGIDGLMPADRYFGLVEEARRAMTTRLKTVGVGLRWLRGVVSEDGAARRAPTVLQVVCRDDKLELVVLGRRFTLG